MSGPIRTMERHSKSKPQAHKAWKALYLKVCDCVEGLEWSEDGHASATEEVKLIRDEMDKLAIKHNLM